MTKRQQEKAIRASLNCHVFIFILMAVILIILSFAWKTYFEQVHTTQAEKITLFSITCGITLISWLIGGLLNNYHTLSKRAIKPSQTVLFYLAGIIGLMITNVIYFFSLRKQIRELYS